MQEPTTAPSTQVELQTVGYVVYQKKNNKINILLLSRGLRPGVAVICNTRPKEEDTNKDHVSQDHASQDPAAILVDSQLRDLLLMLLTPRTSTSIGTQPAPARQAEESSGICLLLQS